ncbi:hypothetical protein [Lihuaxuella thermophila]|uniref:Uncharacterized protein n=1 Tax=Lihuaxuella thermophila TaxID=1173111 RepID=A0A1H8EW05_9BACL|nr:hypothetical protein [Lihuaxuella thermophila]SEN23580.1 hypothetical protein SAMN05444955_107199 [Lihuaxuella thermophila]
MAVAVILLLAALVAGLEIRPLIRKRMKKECWSFAVLSAIATTLAIFMVSEVNMPNPLNGISVLYQPLHDWLSALLR